MEKFVKRQLHNIKMIRFFIICCFFFGMHLIFHIEEYRYDASQYWNYGKLFPNLSDSFRGYVFPMFNAICYKIGTIFGNEYAGYWIISSVVFAILFTYIYKYIAMLLGFNRDSEQVGWSGVACAVVTFVLFRGLFLYPLSDLYAFFVSLGSIILLHKIVTTKSEKKSCFWAVMLGITIYAGYNIRTIYLFVGIVIVAGIIAYFFVKRKWVEMIRIGSFLFVGMCVCALPQMILNNKLYGIFTWKVQTDNLMLLHLFLGIKYDRYGTYIGNPELYRSAAMYYNDYLGQNILAKENIIWISSYSQYLKLIFKYPLDMLGIYVRHFVNMLYPIFPNQYITSLNGLKSVYMLLFYTLFFVSCSTFEIKVKGHMWKWVTIILMLVPCISILPGEVEIRFFIAMHMLIYMYAILSVKKFVMKWKKSWKKCLLYYGTGLLVYIGWCGYMLSTLADGVTFLG